MFSCGFSIKLETPPRDGDQHSLTGRCDREVLVLKLNIDMFSRAFEIYDQ